MARRTVLANVEIDVKHMRQPRAGSNGSEVEVEVVDLWTLQIFDPDAKEVIEVSFGKETRDLIVAAMTGGIVLAGGELPNARTG